jgi:hypothetical protein
MTLANMRSLGVRSVNVVCYCGREANIDVSGMDGAVGAPSLALKLSCSGCGQRPAFVRPNWLEMRAPGTGAGRSKIDDGN